LIQFRQKGFLFMLASSTNAALDIFFQIYHKLAPYPIPTKFFGDCSYPSLDFDFEEPRNA
jgi:hypothetical protein